MNNKAPCLSQVYVLGTTWTDCPVEVIEEVKRLWKNQEYGNDNCYHSWDPGYDAEEYPIIAEFLKSKDITNCLIHYWW